MGVRFGDLPSSDTSYMIGKAEMKAAYDRISPDYQSLLTRPCRRLWALNAFFASGASMTKPGCFSRVLRAARTSLVVPFDCIAY